MDPVCEYTVTAIKEVDAGASVRDATKKLCDFGTGSLLVKNERTKTPLSGCPGWRNRERYSFG